MTWPVVILNGPELNQTLAGIKFDQFGTQTQQEIFVCETWQQGFAWAQNHGHAQALFVKSGTIILDWNQWKDLLNNYPHKGLIAHLIWHPGQSLRMDDQCWFMNIDQFLLEDFDCVSVEHPAPVRSEQNLHDDYTPLWVKPGQHTLAYQVDGFGQGLIARQLQKNRAVVNWNCTTRDLKFFLYGTALDLDIFRDYKQLAESQLWVFNNEPIELVKKSKLLAPGSGLYWILNIVEPATEHIQIVDISHVQVKFCQALWQNWDGVNYGSFVWDFISQNNLIHYQLDVPDLTPIERLKIKGKQKFIEYVNTKFDHQVTEEFKTKWLHARQHKQVEFCNDNLITWVLAHNVDKYDNIWCSNILDYKWTLLHTTMKEYTDFQAKLK